MPVIASFLTKLSIVVRKEIHTDIRTGSAFISLFVFTLTILSAVSLAVGTMVIDERLQSVLFWLIILFSALGGLSRTFIAEKEQHTLLLLRVLADSQIIFFGKLIFQWLLLTLLSYCSAGLFFIFIGNMPVSLSYFALLLLLAAAAIAAVLTLTASLLINAVSGSATLFTIISFPLLLPVLLLAIPLTTELLSGSMPPFAALIPLAAYTIIITAANSILFDYIWYD